MLRRVAPGGTGPEHPHDSAEFGPVIASGATRAWALRRKQRSESLPLRVAPFNSFAPPLLPHAYTPWALNLPWRYSGHELAGRSGAVHCRPSLIACREHHDPTEEPVHAGFV